MGPAACLRGGDGDGGFPTERCAGPPLPRLSTFSHMTYFGVGFVFVCFFGQSEVWSRISAAAKLPGVFPARQLWAPRRGSSLRRLAGQNLSRLVSDKIKPTRRGELSAPSLHSGGSCGETGGTKQTHPRGKEGIQKQVV